MRARQRRLRAVDQVIRWPVYPVALGSSGLVIRSGRCSSRAKRNRCGCGVGTPVARPVGPGFSPLDKELGLGPGGLSPRTMEGMVRLGTRLPFAQAAEELAFFWKVRVSEATVRRYTEAAGAAAVAEATAENEWIAREHPASPPGPDLQQLSVDGAMVPLVGGRWGEVKTVAIGTVTQVEGKDGSRTTQTEELSYCSRLADSATFAEAATRELHRRGTFRARRVVAPTDGAEWIQGFLDYHRPDAVRILDFPHAVEHLATVSQAVWGPGTERATTWLEEQAQTLKHGDPEAVLTEVRALPVAQAKDPGEGSRVQAETLQYLEKRREQIQYAQFVAAGYPIGSGIVESANKLVVEARLKGSGMHWASSHVNPMLELQTVLANGRWHQAWARIAARLTRPRRRNGPPTTTTPPPAAPLPQSVPTPPVSAPRQKTIVNGRPTAQHPWRRSSAFSRRPCKKS